jgi:outer membrane immunogenic protein
LLPFSDYAQSMLLVGTIWMNRQLLLSTAIGLATAPGAALAADMPLKAPLSAPVQQFSWTGPYVGLHAGYGWTVDPAVRCDILPGAQTPCLSGGAFVGAPDVNANGFLGGGQIGYNWQAANWLFGIEADFTGMNVHDVGHFATTDPNYANAQISSRYDWLGTVRGRAGYAMDRTLFYATGGFAYAHISQQYFDSVHGTQGSNGTKTGWTVGGGVEYAINRNWSVKGEYLYVNLPDTSLTTVFTSPGPGPTGSSTATFNFKNDLNIVRLGVNYRF